MSTRMPILRRIVMGNECVQKPGLNTDDSFFDPQVAKSFVRDSNTALFNIDLAYDLSTHGEGIREQTEVIKPPYPQMWMEWKMPSKAYDRDQDCACMILDSSIVKRFYKKLQGQIVFLFFMSLDGAPKWVNMACGYSAKLTDDGRLADTPLLFMSDGLHTPESDTPMEPNLENWIYHGLCVNLLALSLINCKNVSTKESGNVTLSRSGSDKRRKIPARKIKYHTIILPGGGSQSDGKGGHRATALHRVRGHFKTFTAERPLMGQHVGTYWWGWQVRGEIEHGVVVSDYKLEDA